MKRKRAAILARVSTDEQDNARQVRDLRASAKGRGWEVVRVFEVKQSGAVFDKVTRLTDTLKDVLEFAKAGRCDIVMVSEITRISRTNSTVHTFIETLHESGACLFWQSHNMETLLPSGVVNPAAAIMISVMAEFGRAERELIASRRRSGIERARAAGKHLGRPRGSGESRLTILSKHHDIRLMLEGGAGVSEVARETGKARATVRRVRGAMSELT